MVCDESVLLRGAVKHAEGHYSVRAARSENSRSAASLEMSAKLQNAKIYLKQKALCM